MGVVFVPRKYFGNIKFLKMHIIKIQNQGHLKCLYSEVTLMVLLSDQYAYNGSAHCIAMQQELQSRCKLTWE